MNDTHDTHDTASTAAPSEGIQMALLQRLIDRLAARHYDRVHARTLRRRERRRPLAV